MNRLTFIKSLAAGFVGGFLARMGWKHLDRQAEASIQSKLSCKHMGGKSAAPLDPDYRSKLVDRIFKSDSAKMFGTNPEEVEIHMTGIAYLEICRHMQDPDFAGQMVVDEMCMLQAYGQCRVPDPARIMFGVSVVKIHQLIPGDKIWIEPQGDWLPWSTRYPVTVAGINREGVSSKCTLG